MQDRLFDVMFLAPAADYVTGLPEADQAEVRRLVSILRLNPFIDGIYKFPFPGGGLVLTVYDNGSWHVIYRFLNEITIQIWSIHRTDSTRGAGLAR